MTCKKFFKATRPPTLKVARGIVASSAGHKNWGKGMYFYKTCRKFGRIRNEHELKFNRTQRKGIYNWWRSRSVEVKVKRARKKKRFLERQRQRAKNMQRLAQEKGGLLIRNISVRSVIRSLRIKNEQKIILCT